MYGGLIEDNFTHRQPVPLRDSGVKVLGVRNEAVCVATCDGKGVWITHVRRPKGKETALWPKVPATTGLIELGVLTPASVKDFEWALPYDWSQASWSTLQDIWIEFDTDRNHNKVAYVYFDFYNGAMSTDQCSRLIEAMDYVLSQSTSESPIHAITLMGGTYFSNGIALNVIEASEDPAEESWLNINRINDVVHYILHEFPARGILTIAAIRGNAAAGGVALAAACDIVIAGAEVVLNPAYRAIGLSGSEYHTLSYYGRCGKVNAENILNAMTPVGPLQAQRMGLVDYVFPGTGKELEVYIRTHISMLLEPNCLERGFWKTRVDLSPSCLARARARELGEMSKDFWSSRSVRYHSRRFAFVRKIKPTQTPLRFAKHRRTSNNDSVDVEETAQFDDVEFYKKAAEEELAARLRVEVCNEMKARRTLTIAASAKGAGSLKLTQCDEKETLFSCYYKPLGDTPTPPETPVVAALDAQVTRKDTFFGGVESRSKSI